MTGFRKIIFTLMVILISAQAFAEEELKERLHRFGKYQDKLNEWGAMLYHNKNPPKILEGWVPHSKFVGVLGADIGRRTLSVYFKYDSLGIGVSYEDKNENAPLLHPCDNFKYGQDHISISYGLAREGIAVIYFEEGSKIKARLDEILKPVWDCLDKSTGRYEIQQENGSIRFKNISQLDMSIEERIAYSNKIATVIQDYFNSDEFKNLLEKEGIYVNKKTPRISTDQSQWYHQFEF